MISFEIKRLSSKRRNRGISTIVREKISGGVISAAKTARLMNTYFLIFFIVVTCRILVLTRKNITSGIWKASPIPRHIVTKNLTN